MRTTLTLDDDVAELLKEKARLLDLPFKQVVNEAIRRGLGPSRLQEESPEFRIQPNPSGFVPGIDPMKLNQLNDELEVEDFSAEAAQK